MGLFVKRAWDTNPTPFLILEEKNGHYLDSEEMQPTQCMDEQQTGNLKLLVREN